MNNQLNYQPTEQATTNPLAYLAGSNIISHLEPSHERFNYFELHAHQLIEPFDILPAPAH